MLSRWLLAVVDRVGTCFRGGVNAVARKSFESVKHSFKTAAKLTVVLGDPVRDNRPVSTKAHGNIIRCVGEMNSVFREIGLVYGPFAEQDMRHQELLDFFGLAVVAALRVTVGATDVDADIDPPSPPCQSNNEIITKEKVGFFFWVFSVRYL